jgi:hypothetical protein
VNAQKEGMKGESGLMPKASSSDRYSSRLQPFSFAFTTPDTLHPIPSLTKLWLTRLRNAVRLGASTLKPGVASSELDTSSSELDTLTSPVFWAQNPVLQAQSSERDVWNSTLNTQHSTLNTQNALPSLLQNFQIKSFQRMGDSQAYAVY